MKRKTFINYSPLVTGTSFGLMVLSYMNHKPIVETFLFRLLIALSCIIVSTGTITEQIHLDESNSKIYTALIFSTTIAFMVFCTMSGKSTGLELGGLCFMWTLLNLYRCARASKGRTE